MKSFLLSIIVLISLSSYSYSQSDADKIRNELTPLLGQNNMGTDFWFAMPEMFYGYYFESFYIIITSSVDNDVIITSQSKNIFIKARIKAGKDTIIDLNCTKFAEYEYSTNKERIKTRVAKSSALHIESKYPISVFTFNSWNGLKDASLAIPTNSLGNKFMLQTYFVSSATESEAVYPPCVSVTSPFNNTRVELTLSSLNKNLKIKLDNGDSIMAGESVIKILNKGDVWNIYSNDIIGDLSGSLINASNPVNLQYSHANMSQPLDKGYSNEVQSTIFPTNT